MKRQRSFFPAEEADLHLSKDVGHAKSSLLPEGDVKFDRVFGSLNSGELGHSLHVFMADSQKLSYVLFFFWDWFVLG